MRKRRREEKEKKEEGEEKFKKYQRYGISWVCMETMILVWFCMESFGFLAFEYGLLWVYMDFYGWG